LPFKPVKKYLWEIILFTDGANNAISNTHIFRFTVFKGICLILYKSLTLGVSEFDRQV
jgi:hypothetical protein